MLQAPLLGGLFIGVLSALPAVNCCCCLWIVCGGVLAAYLDQQNDPRPITAGRGAWNGFLAGVIGAVVWLAVSMALDVVLAPGFIEHVAAMASWTAGVSPASTCPPGKNQ